MVFHLRPGELQLSQPDQPDRTYVYRDSPALRAVVGQGLTALLAAHQNTVFGHECGRCGNSCRRREILVREQEILGLQQRLGLSEVEFRERYLDPADATWNPGDAFLRLVDGACPFLEPGHPAIPHSASCRVYEVRPQVCRSFRSDASFCRKDPERLLEQVTAVEVFEHETQLTLASGSTHQVPTDPEWWMGLRAQVELSEQSDPAKYAGVLGKALAILADLEAEVVWEGHRDTLLALAELLTSAAELGHLQPSLNEQLENGWVRVQTLLARLDQPPKREPEQPVASRPEGVEWIHLVEAGLTLQTRGEAPRVLEFRFHPGLRELAWNLVQSLLSRPEDSLQQSFQEPEPVCTMCGECCRMYAVEILPSDIHRLCTLLELSPAEFVHTYTGPARFDWNPGSRVLLRVPTPLYSKVLRELPITGQTGPQCVFLERREDGFFYCRVHSHKPQVCRDYPATSSLCRKVNQLPNLGRQAHSLQWVHLEADGLSFQTARGALAQCSPLWVARGLWPEVDQAALALERATHKLVHRSN